MAQAVGMMNIVEVLQEADHTGLEGGGGKYAGETCEFLTGETGTAVPAEEKTGTAA